MMWVLVGLMGWAEAATPAQELALRMWPGSPTATGPSPLTYGRVRLVSEASGWAFTVTHIQDVKTGKELGLSTGEVKYLDANVFDLECGPSAVPYCLNDRTIVVDRVNFKQAKVTHREFELPTVPNCTYADGFVQATTRHGPRYLDYLIEASCGYVFARYDWASGSRLPIKTQVLRTKTWPLPHPK